MKITIYTKFLDENNQRGNIVINEIYDTKTAKTIFRKLIKRWERNKVVKVPTYDVAIASDEIFSIIFDAD